MFKKKQVQNYEGVTKQELEDNKEKIIEFWG
jgi:hypothetical protein